MHFVVKLQMLETASPLGQCQTVAAAAASSENVSSPGTFPARLTTGRVAKAWERFVRLRRLALSGPSEEFNRTWLLYGQLCKTCFFGTAPDEIDKQATSLRVYRAQSTFQKSCLLDAKIVAA